MAKKFEDSRPNRSRRYQYLFLELACPSELLESVPNNESIHKRLNPFAYNDAIIELEEELRVEFWRVVKDNLTERQQEVIKLTSFGETQQYIANKLNINQSSITKSLHGNVDYITDVVTGKRSKSSYGGIFRKLRKILADDPKVQAILKEIAAVREDDWFWGTE